MLSRWLPITSCTTPTSLRTPSCTTPTSLATRSQASSTESLDGSNGRLATYTRADWCSSFIGLIQKIQFCTTLGISLHPAGARALERERGASTGYGLYMVTSDNCGYRISLPINQLFLVKPSHLNLHNCKDIVPPRSVRACSTCTPPSLKRLDCSTFVHPPPTRQRFLTRLDSPLSSHRF